MGLWLPPANAMAVKEAVIEGRHFWLEVTETPDEMRQGLMYRPTLAPNRGMLFVFPSAQPLVFWMKNCLISLDILYFRQGQLVSVQEQVPPCLPASGEPDPDFDGASCPKYPATGLADTVVELPAGTCETMGCTPGSTRLIFAQHGSAKKRGCGKRR